MKYAIPLAMILLLGITASVHRAPARPATPVRQGLMKEQIPQEQTDVRSVGEHPSLPTSTPPETVKPAVAGSNVGPAAASWRKMFDTLDRSLVLTSTQQASVEGVLREREAEIQACHQAIRKSGFLDIRHYDWQVGLMKGSWYRKIDVLLDGAQHVRFVALVEKGLFNEGLGFTVDPGMTVLE